MWPLTILVDNTQAITFQKGTCVNSKLRGTFEMRREFVGELRNSKEIDTKYVYQQGQEFCRYINALSTKWTL